MSGNWSRQADGSYKGTVDASLTARMVRGSETDSDYEFHVKVKIASGKVAAIANFTYSEDWEEQYLEMLNVLLLLACLT